MKNFVEEGKTMQYTVAGKAVKSGDVIVIGEHVGVAVTSGEVDENIALAVEGVYELPKGNGALAQGSKAYVNTSEEGVTTIVGTATGNKYAGIVWEAAPASTNAVLIKLNA